eukprot:Em0003g1479a
MIAVRDVNETQGEHNQPCPDIAEPYSATCGPECGETRLVLKQCLSDSTDSGVLDEEYPDPVGATLKQKEMRRLARLKQVEEYKARELAESREERFRRRQSGASLPHQGEAHQGAMADRLSDNCSQLLTRPCGW